MKLVGITIKQEDCLLYKEVRDQLDTSFYSLLRECDIIPILLPNDDIIVKKYLDEMEFSGFILSGGGLPFPYSGRRTVRDYIENKLIEHSLVKDLPVLGICRGMQALGVYFGAKLVKVEGHVDVIHKIKDESGEIKVKNSFHNWAIKEGNELIHVSMFSEDGVVEAVVNEENQMHGIMWHPERMNKYEKDDIEYIRKIFR